MTGIRSTLGSLFGGERAEIPDAPDAELTVAPQQPEQLTRLLEFASEHGLAVLPWGSGTHQGFGAAVDPDIVVSTSNFSGVDAWEPDDLTVVVGAGTSLAELADRLATRRQTAVLPETETDATVGGVVAAGLSAWRRLRFGPTRDRVLQVSAVTGDGRFVTSGARVVKNVTGYDLPKLFTGSYGSLGVITSVCLKLWPEPSRTATVVTDDPTRALAVTHRPLAVLETPDRCRVHLGGTPAEVEAQAAAVGGSIVEGLDWPDAPAGDCLVRVRVPPAQTAAATARLDGADFVAAHGVGEIRASVEPAAVAPVREWAESVGGAVVFERSPDGIGLDPWGAPPAGLDQQRRIKAAFDPARIMVPGRLPGGI